MHLFMKMFVVGLASLAMFFSLIAAHWLIGTTLQLLMPSIF